MKSAGVLSRVAAGRSAPAVAAATSKSRSVSPWSLGLRAALLATGSLGAAVVGISAYAAYRLTRPNRSYGEGEPPEGGYERVWFSTRDGLALAGWFLPAAGAEHAVVLCHGFQTGKREMLPLALALRERGHHVLLFDFRGHGESDGRWTTCGLLETYDLEGAVRYLLARPDVKNVSVIGFSMGGAVAILTAARLPEIQAVVADSSFATLKDVIASGFRAFYRLPHIPFAPLTLWFSERLVGVKADDVRPLDAISELAPRPVFLIHGTEDKLVPLSEAFLLYESAGEPRELWTVAGADHVGARLIDFEGYVDRVDRFLKKQLIPAEGSARL